MSSQNFSIIQASKNSEIAINCALTKEVIMLKNKMSAHPSLFYLNRLGSKLFDRLSTMILTGITMTMDFTVEVPKWRRRDG